MLQQLRQEEDNSSKLAKKKRRPDIASLQEVRPITDGLLGVGSDHTQ